jgi:16S rRNA (cytosine1402-N4)-methyltransferase
MFKLLTRGGDLPIFRCRWRIKKLYTSCTQVLNNLLTLVRGMGLKQEKNMHLPVLKKEILEFLNPKEGDTIVDCTLGLGGHAASLLQKVGKTGRLIGFDADTENLKTAEKKLEKYEKQITLIHRNFRHLSDELSKSGLDHIDSILLDLGLSSPHVDDPEKGFSFSKTGALDMRYDRTKGISAYDVINKASSQELAQIFWEFGEERGSRKIANAICTARKENEIKTTTDLADVIKQIRGYKSHIDPATRVFQALRIYVNDELSVLLEVLPQAVQALREGGKIAVISYHSLEDRIVKNFFRDSTKDCLCSKENPVCICDHKPTLKILTKKPVAPSEEELTENRRARSAKLRVAEKL